MANPLTRRIASLEHEHGRRVERSFVEHIRELTQMLMSDERARDLAEQRVMEFITNNPPDAGHRRMLAEREEMVRQLQDRDQEVHPSAGSRHSDDA